MGQESEKEPEGRLQGLRTAVRFRTTKIRELWNRVVTTRVKHIVTGMFLWMFVFLAVQYQVLALGREAEKENRRSVAIDLYQQELATYQIKFTQRETCIKAAINQDSVRALFFGLYDGIEEALGGNPDWKAFLDRERSRVDTTLEIFDIGECPPAPVAPTVPPIIQE